MMPSPKPLESHDLPFERIEQQLRGYGEKTLERCIEECIQIEEDIKTGKIGDQIGVEALICKLLLP